MVKRYTLQSNSMAYSFNAVHPPTILHSSIEATICHAANRSMGCDVAQHTSFAVGDDKVYDCDLLLSVIPC